MTQPAISIKDYSFKYYNSVKKVLDNCNFTLNYGEMAVMYGLSGEGKSTLLNSINGVIPNIIPGEYSGEILINGRLVFNRKVSDLAREVGSVMQNADSQIIHSKVEDEIAFACENLNYSQEEIREKIKFACEIMQLDPKWDTYSLSGGQKQRLITATTLVMGQKILVFDEPLANLDLEGSHMLLKVLRKLADNEGYAILFVEHRVDIVLPYADFAFRLKDGKVQKEVNKKDTIFKNIGIIEDISTPKNGQETILELKDIKFTVGDREILKNISFDVMKGERVVILGENGCGKTTLMRIIARLTKPSGGTVVQNIDEKISNKPCPKWFAKVGYVYQNPNYQLFMPTVKSEVGYQSNSEVNTNKFMEHYKLEELSDRHPQSLSEGQKRRVSIAAITANNPQVLLLDEPTVGQDYDGLKRIVDTLNTFHKNENITMITVTHDYRCASALADKVVWIKDGLVYKIGSKDLINEYFGFECTQQSETRIRRSS